MNVLRELRTHRQACKRAQTALENAALTALLMASIVAVPLFVAVVSTFIH